MNKHVKSFSWLLLLFLASTATCFAGVEDMQRVKLNILELSGDARPDIAKRYIAEQLPDGSWADINYQDDNRSRWAVANHASRLTAMANAYHKQNSEFYKQKEVSQKIHLGMKYWFDGNFVCSNWWFNQIGVPRILGTFFLLMQEEMSGDEMAKAIKYMQNSKLGMTGQNSAWLAENVLVTAILQKDEKAFLEAREYILKELIVSQDGEGIRPDMSFHQHGFQQQFGNYGLSFAFTQTYWARIFRGSLYDLSKEQLNVIRDYLMDGLQWTVWKGYMDIGSCGRQVFRNAQNSKAISYGSALANMMEADPVNKNDYQKVIDRDVKPVVAENTLIGNKYFHYSDYLIHRSTDWCSALKMSSNRVIGSEIVNSENLLGIYMGNGAVFFYRDGKEYEDIFPVWDWKKLPGVTAYDSDDLFPNKEAYFKNRHDFVGGVSDMQSGVAALILNDMELTARKSYFFMDDAVVCLGSGIEGDKAPAVTTAIDQKLKRGEVNVYKKNSDQNNVFYHDGIVYYSFVNCILKMESGKATGNWRRVATMFDTTPVEEEVFSLWIDHGASPKDAKYGYMVLPKVTKGNWAAAIEKADVQLLRHDRQAHAICHQNVIQSVFFEPSSIIMPDGKVITAEKGCLIMMKQEDAGLLLSVSEPTRKEKETVLRLTGKWEGDYCQYNEQGRETVITVPTENVKGKTIQFQIKS